MSNSSILRGSREQTTIHGAGCIHQAFMAQAMNTPQNIAVAYRQEVLTYEQLDDRSNRLARHLVASGVGIESLVGICAEPSIELVVAVLGALKAGAAYVPLDPQYPPMVLDSMIADCKPQVILTMERQRKSLEGQTSTLLFLDTDAAQIAQSSGERLDIEVDPQNLAYVIYTSGSTGKPKGTLVEHRGVVNYLSWCLDRYAVGAGSGSPVHSSLSFDLTVTSLLAPLVAGRTTILLPPSIGIGSLSHTSSTHQDLSLIKLTPLHLELLSQRVDPARAMNWTHSFVIGGENLLSKGLEFWRSHAPNTKLFNEYGPTETVVGCCVFEVTEEVKLGHSVPIGRPIYNMDLYVLDSALNPVPGGDEGELYISGIGVARGYLNRPELTAERFIQDPFSIDGPRKMYRTGDIVRSLPDGNLEFLGRIDDQVKVKGHRVELAEIEAALREFPMVREAAVIVVGSGSDAKIVAVLCVTGAEPALAAVRKHCAERLPKHMVIDQLTLVEHLPSTINGKVDKKQLLLDQG